MIYAPFEKLEDALAVPREQRDLNEYTRAFTVVRPENKERYTAELQARGLEFTWCTSGNEGKSVVVIGKQFVEDYPDNDMKVIVDSMKRSILDMADRKNPCEVFSLDRLDLRWRKTMRYVFEKGREQAIGMNGRASGAILVYNKGHYQIALFQELIYDEATDLLLDRVQDRNLVDMVREFTTEPALGRR